jgi:hypothetical protein
MATKKAVENLKIKWLSNPSYPLEEAEGFERHKEELLKFRLNAEREWKKEELIKKLESMMEESQNNVYFFEDLIFFLKRMENPNAAI